MMKTIGILFSTAFYAVFLQNLVLCGGFGLSPLLRIASKGKHLLQYTVSIVWFSAALSAANALLLRLPVFHDLSVGVNLLLTGGLLLALYLLTILIAKLALRASPAALRRLSICAVNSLVMAVPLISQRLAHPLWESVGLGLGAGISFALSVWLLSAGIRKMEENRHIPPFFQGMPSLLLYVGILSMAFMAVFGRSYIA